MRDFKTNLALLGAAVRRRHERLFYRHTMQLPASPATEVALPITTPAAALAAIERILARAFLPFWTTKCAPDAGEGYRLNHDIIGRWMGRRPQRTVAQTRTLWFFAMMASSGDDPARDRALAQPGADFLLHRLWDHRYGGFFWEVRPRSGLPSDSRKHLFAHAFALFALSEYTLASGDGEAARAADATFEVMETRFHDPADGGYREVFHEDWREIADDQPGLLGVAPDIKLRNTHMHVLEALSVYYSLRPDALVRQRLLEPFNILAAVAIRPDFATGSEEHRRNWRPLFDDQSAVSSYGHDLEYIHVALQAADALGDGQAPPLELFAGLFDHAVSYGYDHERGGFFATGRPGTPASDCSKIWWVQAETLLAALVMFRRTDESRYWHLFCRTLEWIVCWQTDWVHGDWHTTIAPDGVISGAKASVWKEPYHHGRAMMSSRHLLRDMLTDAGAT
ncbi:MAG TPA: AGE family epimerase/isomerase [Defluviicoccus sp.]|nr:AGE family epimerase/isomerase [Defluviicoccus sp.]